MAETDRNTVLSTLQQFGGSLSLSQAAAKFGLPRGTIGRWAKERNDGRVDPVRLAIVPSPASPSAPPVSARAKSPSGREVWATQVADALGDRVRGNLRTSIDSTSEALANLAKRAVDGEEVAQEMVNLARTMDALLARAGDLLAFDRSTAAPGETRSGPDLLDAKEVAEAFRAKQRASAAKA